MVGDGILTFGRNELEQLTREAADPVGFCPVTRPLDNVGLSDVALVESIRDRNALGKLTYLLRLEYPLVVTNGGQ